MTEYYILVDGAETGPFDAEELAEVQGSARVPYPVVTALDSLDPTVQAFLRDGHYDSPEAWMLDSDYYYRDADEWRDEYGTPVDMLGVIAGAMEALES